MSGAPRRPGRRSSRSLPAALTGLLFLVAGALLAWLVGTRLAAGHWPAAALPTLRSTAAHAVGSTALAGVWVLLALLGLALLLAGLLPGSTRRALLDSHGVPGDTLVAHRDVERLLADRAERANGVRRATARVRRDRVDVVVDSILDDRDRVGREVGDACRAALADLQPLGNLEPLVRVRVDEAGR